MCLPNFDIHKGTVGPNRFKSHINFLCPHFFQKKVLSDIWSAIQFVRVNIASRSQSVRPSGLAVA